MSKTLSPRRAFKHASNAWQGPGVYQIIRKGDGTQCAVSFFPSIFSLADRLQYLVAQGVKRPRGRVVVQ